MSAGYYINMIVTLIVGMVASGIATYRYMSSDESWRFWGWLTIVTALTQIANRLYEISVYLRKP